MELLNSDIGFGEWLEIFFLYLIFLSAIGFVAGVALRALTYVADWFLDDVLENVLGKFSEKATDFRDWWHAGTGR